MLASDIRRQAMERAAAAVAYFDPSRTASDGACPCSSCGEECTRNRSSVQDSGPRLMRYFCERKQGSNGRGRGGLSGHGGCNWRLCFYCAYGLDTTSTISCAICGYSAEELADSGGESSDGEHDGSGQGQDQWEDEGDDRAEDELEKLRAARGRGCGMGRATKGRQQAELPEPELGGPDAQVGTKRKSCIDDVNDDLFAMGLPLPEGPRPTLSDTYRSGNLKAASSEPVCEKAGDDGEEGKGSESDEAVGGLTDRMIDCRECGTCFTFTSLEQQSLLERGFPVVKTRCAPCKQYKKNRFAAKSPRSEISISEMSGDPLQGKVAGEKGGDMGKGMYGGKVKGKGKGKAKEKKSSRGRGGRGVRNHGQRGVQGNSFNGC